MESLYWLKLYERSLSCDAPDTVKRDPHLSEHSPEYSHTATLLAGAGEVVEMVPTGEVLELAGGGPQ
jgi:hypothetical protein